MSSSLLIERGAKCYLFFFIDVFLICCGDSERVQELSSANHRRGCSRYRAACVVLLLTNLCAEDELPDPKFASVMQILLIQRK